MKRVFVVSGKRTAIGTYGGSLKDVSVGEMGAACIKAVLQESGLGPDRVDEVIMGNVLSAGQGMGPGRQAAIFAGVPAEKPAWTANMICGSGLKTVMLGVQSIVTGQSEIVVAGGMENMSAAPMLLPAKVRFGSKMGDLIMIDSLISDGLTDVFNRYHMGGTAENIAQRLSISREEQDEFALSSQKKAASAAGSGRFTDEIVPMNIQKGRKEFSFVEDEHIRKDVSIEELSSLRAVFKEGGTVTAGNASGINDGASAVLLASDRAVSEEHLTPVAEILAYHQVGLDPAVMGLGPLYAIEGLMEKAGISFKEVGLFELNEAFASQSIGVVKGLSSHFDIEEEWIYERTNVNGGAIALGHPLGASGNRILVTLLHEMVRRDVEYGIASLCIGGGMGVAILVKNVINDKRGEKR